MFTVKWITPSGEEFLYATGYTNFVPGPAKSQQPVPEGGWRDSFWIEREDHRTFEFTEGTIFVMNEAGATVARHHLAAAPATPMAQAA